MTNVNFSETMENLVDSFSELKTAIPAFTESEALITVGIHRSAILNFQKAVCAKADKKGKVEIRAGLQCCLNDLNSLNGRLEKIEYEEENYEKVRNDSPQLLEQFA